MLLSKELKNLIIIMLSISLCLVDWQKYLDFDVLNQVRHRLFHIGCGHNNEPVR
jgi:hypothetical protein